MNVEKLLRLAMEASFHCESSSSLLEILPHDLEPACLKAWFQQDCSTSSDTNEQCHGTTGWLLFGRILSDRATNFWFVHILGTFWSRRYTLLVFCSDIVHYFLSILSSGGSATSSGLRCRPVDFPTFIRGTPNWHFARRTFSTDQSCVSFNRWWCSVPSAVDAVSKYTHNVLLIVNYYVIIQLNFNGISFVPFKKCI